MATPQQQSNSAAPPLPPGYVLDSGSGSGSAIPPMPAGYQPDSSSAPPEKPGFFKRLGQSLGLPTSMDEVTAMQAAEDALPWYKKIIPHAPGSDPGIGTLLAGPGGAAAADMISNYGKTAYRGFTQGSKQLAETSGQVGRGDISMPQAFAKSADAGLHMALQATPIIGPAIDTAGQDIGPMPEGHFLYNPDGNYRGAAGGLTGVVAQVAAPDIIANTPKAFRGITQSISDAAPNLSAKVGATAKLVGQDALSHVPVVGRVVRRPSFMDYVEAAKTEADPQLDLFNNTPKLGDSPLFATNPDAARPTPPGPTAIAGPRIPEYRRIGSESVPAEQPPRAEPSGEWNPDAVPRGITQSVPTPAEPAPAPYRMKGDQIQDATTVTPRQIIGPERQLAAGEPPAAPPPRGITQGKAPYVPGAQMEPAPFLSMHGAEDGSTAALMQLAHTGGQALRRIAQARGLKIPAAADTTTIIQKIHADLSHAEIQQFSDAAAARAAERAESLKNVDPAIVSDNRAIAKKLYDQADQMQAAGESPYRIRAWRTAGESIETRPTAVRDILNDPDALKSIKGVDSKMAQHIQDVARGKSQLAPGVENAAAAPKSPRGITRPAAAAPVASEGVMTNSSDIEGQLQRQIDAIKARPPRGITSGESAPAAPDRRLNIVQRQKVSEMTPDQMQQELLTSEKTGLPNRRAFDEAGPAKAVAMSDADGLKALNDKFGYEAGDALLKAKADALKEAGLDAYHDKGDEFVYRGESPEDLQGKLDQARDILKNKTINVEMSDGRRLQFKGADFSYGAGQDISAAEAGLKVHKGTREAAGERARGQLRGITQIGSEAGPANNGGTASAAKPPGTKVSDK